MIAHDPYPTRGEVTEDLIARREPVVYEGGQRPAHFGALEEADYAGKGFVVLRGLFSSEEIEGFQAEVERLRAAPALRGREEVVTEPASGDVRSVFAVHALSPVFARLSADVRLTGIARYLTGGEVYIHQSRVNYKPGFTGEAFGWHSDFETWHAEDGMPAMRAVSCSVLLTENRPENGPLMLMPGSHRWFVPCPGQTPENHYQMSLRRQEIGVPSPAALKKLAAGGVETVLGPPGTVVFFDCNTMHGSNSNISPWPRSNVFLVFNHAGNALVEPFCGQQPRPVHVAARPAQPPPC